MQRLPYLAVAAGIFLVEVAIAQGLIQGPHVRESVGDMLVIVLIYAFLRGTIGCRPSVSASIAFGLGVSAELLQYFHFVDWLGLKPDGVVYTVLGNTATLSDLLMYALGGLLALGVDAYLLRGKPRVNY